ncbi:hypothetical protein SDC9_105932 [bioreactor metagenome]|uniref:Uncharacterized protein n=1 Tax=bioreactor metagenome TaxID=1076179 RepID=A0A645BBK6_9ZZZZ
MSDTVTAVTPSSSPISPTNGLSACKAWQTRPLLHGRMGRLSSIPNVGRIPTPTGWRTSTTGASAASSGGGTAFPSGSARIATRSLWNGTIPPPAPRARVPILSRKRMCSIHGSVPGSGPSAPLAGLRKLQILHAFSPPAPWSPAMISSSSGYRA